jgi:hypothetical protein
VLALPQSLGRVRAGRDGAQPRGGPRRPGRTRSARRARPPRPLHAAHRHSRRKRGRRLPAGRRIATLFAARGDGTRGRRRFGGSPRSRVPPRELLPLPPLRRGRDRVDRPFLVRRPEGPGPGRRAPASGNVRAGRSKARHPRRSLRLGPLPPHGEARGRPHATRRAAGGRPRRSPSRARVDFAALASAGGGVAGVHGRGDGRAARRPRRARWIAELARHRERRASYRRPPRRRRLAPAARARCSRRFDGVASR